MNHDEPDPEPLTDLTPPDWLHEDAKREWNDKAPMMCRLGLLTEADRDAFSAYCQTFARWKEAEKKLLQFGLVIKSTSNNGIPMVSPYLNISNKAQTQAIKLLAEFGLTPASRSHVAVKAGKASSDLFSTMQRKRLTVLK